MKHLKFLLITNNFNENGISLCNKLNDIGSVEVLNSHDNNKIITAIISSEIDVVFLDIDYLGSHEALRINNFIENITGKVCIFIKNNPNESVGEYKNYPSIYKYGLIDYTILKLDLFSLIIDCLNKFNKNKLLRKEKCYDFIYIVWEDLSIKKIEINAIKEIFKYDKATYLLCDEKITKERIINISFEMLYKLLNKNFEKSRFKIINKQWQNNNIKNQDFFIRNSA
jgi:hypothetical protein